MNFTIRQKLTIAFSFMALSMLISAVFGVFNLRQLNADMGKALNDHQSALIDASGIVSNVLFHGLKIEQYIASGNPAHMRAVADLKANIDGYLADIQKKNMDPQETQLVRKIAEAYQTYTVLSDELLDHYQTKQRDREIMAGKQMRILALLENTLLADSTSLYRLKQLKAAALIETNRRHYHEYLWITLLVGLFSVLLAVLTGLSITYSISNPINKLIRATKEITAGNLGARPPAQGADEIGILGRAFITMANQLQNLFTTLENRVAERTRALAEEQQFVSAVLDTTNALVMVLDAEGRIVRFNNACKEITGYSLQEVKGQPVWELLMLPEHAENYRILFEKLKKNSPGGAFENYWVAKNGALRLISWSHTALRDRSGVVLHLVATGTDITEKRKLEQAFFRASKFESVGVLAGGIAHDFNNLLTGIHGEIELAQCNTLKGSKPYQNLARAVESCNRARDLIWQFITISKGGAPRKQEELLSPLIKEVCDRILTGSKISHQIMQADGLWPVAFDRTQMEQVIANLVLNARESMTGEGMLRIWLENAPINAEKPSDILEPGPYVRIVIQDEGRGIPEKHLPLLFDPYFSTKERGSQKGMGLGLTTAYSIVKKHDGHIDLVSKVGVGTTFYIYLPANRNESGE